MWRLNMHSDVHVLQFILWIIFMCLTVTQTQQDEVKTTWNNRLYPTNSVYEVSPSGQTSNDNNAMGKATDDEAAGKTEEDAGGAIEEYDDDYELEDIDEISKDVGGAVNPEKTQYETGDGEFTEEYDSEFVYDDYDNGTDSQAPSADVSDYTLADESLRQGNMWEVKNSSGILEQLREKSKQEGKPGKEVEEGGKQRAEENYNDGDEEGGTYERESESGGTDDDGKILIGEAVVSVVTTKSVVNGTFAVPTLSPMTTEQMAPPPTTFPSITSTTPQSLSRLLSPSHVSNIETTEDSIIVASVQTSRSISGAHYLPFDLNNENHSTNMSIADDPNNKTLPLESTESIIDKLDRVQSELSSGFLTGGFRTAGNALQLDVLSEQRPTPTRKTFTTTGKTPVISKFIPRRQTDRKSTIATTDNTFVISSEIPQMMNEQTPTEKPKSPFKIPWPGSPRIRLSSTTVSSRIPTRKLAKIIKAPVTGDIRAFLPAGFELKNEDVTTHSSLLSDILARSKVNLSTLVPANYKVNNGEIKKNASIKTTSDTAGSLTFQSLLGKSNVDTSALLPSDFTKRESDEESKVAIISITTTTVASAPIQKTLQELFSKSSVDIAALLPPGYQEMKNKVGIIQEEKKIGGESASSIIPTTSRPGGVKLVFPSRPGGRKASPKTAIQQNRGADVSMFVTPKIQKGWPTRTTTEFTGWPTPSTTPISIEKLLEAARTATVSPLNSSIPPTTTAATTTSTSTTTSTTMRPTTPGLCEDECEVAGTIRIVGNTTWIPELLDRNTREWQQLANEIEKEMNLVFLKSAVLRKWYKNVRIDAFSQGSILVDYFIELQDLTQKVNTQELKVLFHDSLRAYNAHRWNETKVKGPMRLGEFVIDPKFTDFVIIPKVNLPQPIEKDDRLIPQWAIAVIVIGVGGLLFIIVFGVSVLVNRQNASKLKPPIPGMYGEEAAKNIIHSSHVAASHRSSQDYPKSETSTIWNETDAWREKSFESTSNEILVDGMLPGDKKYNAYDSWRSEWNGYYYQPSHTSSKFAGYESTAGFSRHPPDYDTNF